MTAINSIAPIVAWPWHLRTLAKKDQQHGGQCCHCRREIAIAKDERGICLYCAMDRGLIPLIDEPLKD